MLHSVMGDCEPVLFCVTCPDETVAWVVAAHHDRWRLRCGVAAGVDCVEVGRAASVLSSSSSAVGCQREQCVCQ